MSPDRVPDARTYDITRFGLSDMVRTAADLRRLAELAVDFSAAARAVVTRLHDCFTDEHGPVLPLVRLLTIRAGAELEHPGVSAAARYLVLEAAVGPYAEAEVVRELPRLDELDSMPFMAAMTREFGLSPGDTVHGRGDGDGYGVFHVPVAAGSGFLRDQALVTEHGIASVLGFGGVLPGGTPFAAVLYSRVPVPAGTAEQFKAVAIGLRVGLLAHGAGLPAERDALRQHLTVLEKASRDQATALEEAVEQWRAAADLVDSLQVVGRRLTAQLDIDAMVQDATDAATKATGAAFGAFFYNLIDSYGESYTLFTLSGVPRSAFEKFPMPRNTKVFAPTFVGTGTTRSPNITIDERYGQNPPYHGMPRGHLPVCSYLAVPVVSPSSGEVLGGFFFGHPEPDQFTERHEQLAEGIAGYSAIALDNARLFARQRTMATELARSMLPTIPPTPGLRVLSRYLPAATGAEVGGDWFDVVSLPVGRTAFVIGDVAGRGVSAAAVMGQIRTAVRSYALLDLPPSEVLRNSSELAMATPDADFITCLYAVHDPTDNTLTFSSAGHLPAVYISPDGTPSLIGQMMGMPLGVGTTFTQQQIEFPVGARLALYTDGLVETRNGYLNDGIESLASALRELPADDNALDELITHLTAGAHTDDVALLYVLNEGNNRHFATLALTTAADAAARARDFTTRHLEAWGLGVLTDRAVTIASELVTNAIMHTGQPAVLRLHADSTRLGIDVSDYGPTRPRTLPAALEDEHHRGLHIVESFASRWGTRTTHDGKVVWAEIILPRKR
ncbi:serine phosphatase RsbU (regulator of sigma subunit)/anti-sigma regulatory factor (Ser/Thr protein kinase) [Actinokineospora baliensis]|uniref:ATP-binding SpoIIE family protein phosphatase n=1 Tax=Actinokineospora baliensis TaxID=547056 RepID=UPI0027DEA7F9|nr:SpoIIE family protein phosphatase [Actinokineospora baliensis]MBM7773692.1 serine phosphatase RsbU (regulator of sigma subunit)/anti-sigma regulatory factor (Ser/Thr protein kinase) [Actinokineospora baliensis]